MINEIIIGVIGFLTTVISAWASWFFARKKYNAEVDHTHIENMNESLEFYKKLSDDNRRRLEEAIVRSNEMEKEIQELRKQILNLTLNICLDLTCAHRVREQKKRRASIKTQDKFDEVTKSVKDNNNEETHT